ncbi:MAG TPA: hypothetical protein VH025_05560 [Solirubrobacteraceae bacterium]|jgi:hypothetical protein|nr:hypothetical protein [Solirubrobacteraceae bacterium]
MSTHIAVRRLLASWALALVAALAGLPAPAGAALSGVRALTGTTTPATTKPAITAMLEGCVNAETQSQRSATFAGEMQAIPGSAKMEIRIDVLERSFGETPYRTVTAPGLGVWRNAAPGVKVFKYLKQVTNLASPAIYRGAVRFRWLNAKGKLMHAAELRTPRCAQL